MCMLYHTLEAKREKYVKSIVEAPRIRCEATAPQRTQRIAETCVSYAARNLKLMEQISTM